MGNDDLDPIPVLMNYKDDPYIKIEKIKDKDGNFLLDGRGRAQTKEVEKFHSVALSANVIYKEFKDLVGEWPILIGETLFAMENDRVIKLKKQRHLFAWIATKGITVDWLPRLKASICKEVFFEYVVFKSKLFRGIEVLPHYPPMPDIHYVLPPDPTGIYQGTMTSLLKKFKPATPVDAVLIKAMFLTPLWGGPYGKKASFVLLGAENDKLGGRGVGKSTMVDTLAMLYGDAISISADVKFDSVTKRLLTVSASRRLITIDNAKGKVGNEAVEKLTTAPTISGWKHYEGDGAMPNSFTWIITFNDPTFSKDMSQRFIPIRLGRPKHNPTWWRELESYVKENRWKIISDGIRILKTEPLCELKKHSRFPEWDDDVLTRCTKNPKITDEIENRQAETECEEDPVIDQFTEILTKKLGEYEFGGGMKGTESDITKYCYQIRQSLFIAWIKSEMRDYSASRVLKVLHKERPEWLRMGRQADVERQDGRLVLGTKVRGTYFLTIGQESVSTAWVIDADARLNRYVDKTASVNTTDGDSGEPTRPNKGPSLVP